MGGFPERSFEPRPFPEVGVPSAVYEIYTHHVMDLLVVYAACPYTVMNLIFVCCELHELHVLLGHKASQ